MELKQIRMVLTLAQHRHFGRAGRELGLTQSALSKSLRALEDDLGCPLFDRGAGEVRLTAAGEEVVQRGAAILHDVEEIGHHLERLRGLDAGRLCFGVGPAYSDHPVGAALGRFVGRHPRVDVDPAVGAFDDLIRRLHLGEIEFCVVTVPDEVEGTVEITELAPRKIVLFARGDHPLTKESEIELSQIFGYPLVALPLIPSARRTFHRAVDMLGSVAQAARPPIEIADRAMLREVLLSSDAVAIGTHACLSMASTPGELAAITIAGDPLESLGGTPGGIVSRSDRGRSPAAEELVRLIVQADAQALESNPQWFVKQRFSSTRTASDE